jgi:hypothetical protein
MKNNRRFAACAAACMAMLAGSLALAATAADAQTSNGGGNGGTGNMGGMSGMAGMQSASTRGSILDLLRAAIATAPFHSLDVAKRFGGYTAEVADVNNITCIAQPPDGAMGVHFLNPGLVDLNDDPTINDTVDASTPELLVYEPDGVGHFRLVALEYLILQKEWDTNHSSPPSLFGQDFMLTPGGNRFGLPAFYSLHAWIWKFNPSGTFAMWNPQVHCPA